MFYNPEYRNKEVYKELFNHTDKPVYVTNYRLGKNEGKTDEFSTSSQPLLENVKAIRDNM